MHNRKLTTILISVCIIGTPCLCYRVWRPRHRMLSSGTLRMGTPLAKDSLIVSIARMNLNFLLPRDKTCTYSSSSIKTTSTQTFSMSVLALLRWITRTSIIYFQVLRVSVVVRDTMLPIKLDRQQRSKLAPFAQQDECIGGKTWITMGDNSWLSKRWKNKNSSCSNRSFNKTSRERFSITQMTFRVVKLSAALRMRDKLQRISPIRLKGISRLTTTRRLSLLVYAP